MSRIYIIAAYALLAFVFVATMAVQVGLVFLPAYSSELAPNWGMPSPWVLTWAVCGIAALVCFEVFLSLAAALVSRAQRERLFESPSLSLLVWIQRVCLAALALTLFAGVSFLVVVPSGHPAVTLALVMAIVAPALLWLIVSFARRALDQAAHNEAELAGVI